MPVRLIYLVSFVEGFSTLAVEIIAMRLAIPVVGSSIVLTSVFLGIILLALSAGYWSGGIVGSKLDDTGRKRLLGGALLFAGVWYVLISFTFERALLERVLETTDAYILTLFIVVVVLFFLPVFIASHTIPILTELLDEPSKGKAAGSMLFASTIGSFFGSVVTSIFLFQRLGVQLTGVLVGTALIFLAAWVYVYYNKKLSWLCVLIGGLLLFFFGFQNDESSIFVFDSAYQHIEIKEGIHEEKLARVFATNGSHASGIYVDDESTTPFSYINEAIKITDQIKPQKILVIGSAGFTYPQMIAKRSYATKLDAIDIDPTVAQIAQDHFLKEELNDKINFIPLSARGALHELEKKSYDLILIDAYNGRSIPEELMTLEFFQQIDDLLAPEGSFVANMILDKLLVSVFANSSFETMQSVRPGIYFANVSNNEGSDFDNFLVSNMSFSGYTKNQLGKGKVYTDDKHSIANEIVVMLKF